MSDSLYSNSRDRETQQSQKRSVEFEKYRPQFNKSEPVLDNKHMLSIPARTLDPPISLVDRAREIELADQTLQSHVDGKLDLIMRQIRSLQSEAKELIQSAARDADLHRVRCHFEKVIGQAIHLYEKPDGERYFSLLSPADWAGSPPHYWCGSFMLEADRSFKVIELPKNEE